MGKQKNLFKQILAAFDNLDHLKNQQAQLVNTDLIKLYYKKSLNKKDLTRRILFDALLSDDDILKLLRIIFDKVQK
jgi:hypothetical protein